MRLIDADAFAEFLKDAVKQQKYENTKIDRLLTVADVIEAVISELEGTSLVGFKNAPTIEPKPHWIPCSERLPEEGERVLCTHLGGLNPNRQVIEHVYEGGQFTLGWEMDLNPSSPTFGQRYMGKVIAWMP